MGTDDGAFAEDVRHLAADMAAWTALIKGHLKDRPAWTQARLARQMGVGPTQMSSWMAGREALAKPHALPGAEASAHAARALGLDTQDTAELVRVGERVGRLHDRVRKAPGWKKAAQRILDPSAPEPEPVVEPGPVVEAASAPPAAPAPDPALGAEDLPAPVPVPEPPRAAPAAPVEQPAGPGAPQPDLPPPPAPTAPSSLPVTTAGTLPALPQEQPAAHRARSRIARWGFLQWGAAAVAMVLVVGGVWYVTAPKADSADTLPPAAAGPADPSEPGQATPLPVPSGTTASSPAPSKASARPTLSRSASPSAASSDPQAAPTPAPSVTVLADGEKCRGPVVAYTSRQAIVDVCARRSGDDVYMVGYIQSTQPVSVDLYLWLKGTENTSAIYPADKAVVWTNVPVTSTQVRKETRIAMRLTPGATYTVCIQDYPPGSPAPNIKNPAVDGRQVEFTY